MIKLTGQVYDLTVWLRHNPCIAREEKVKMEERGGEYCSQRTQNFQTFMLLTRSPSAVALGGLRKNSCIVMQLQHQPEDRNDLLQGLENDAEWYCNGLTSCFHAGRLMLPEFVLPMCRHVLYYRPNIKNTRVTI